MDVFLNKMIGLITLDALIISIHLADILMRIPD